jgi:class 3 adenylate cyclase/HAMP domain-containing protein
VPQVLFSLAEPRILVLVVLCTTIVVYFLTLRNKTRDLIFLIGAFCTWTVHFLLMLTREMIYPLPVWVAAAEMCVGLAGLVLFLGFACSFGEEPSAPRVRQSVVGATIITFAYTAFLAFRIMHGESPLWPAGSGTAVVLFGWAEGVLVLRWKRARTAEEGRPYRSFALVFLLSVAAVGVYFIRDVGLCPPDLASLLASLFYLCTLVGFTLVYVNYSARPTTFRVKIIGATLFTILSVITILWTAVAPSSENGAISAYDMGTEHAPITEAQLAISARAVDVQEKIVRCNYSIMAAVLFVVTIFPGFFRVSMVNPLTNLLGAVDQLDQGVREVQVPVAFNDEIGRLTSSFNRMARSLKAAEDDLRNYAESLEAKVRERTMEIAQKNEENERLLLHILPASIAERLKHGESTIADACSEVTILFADVVGFTELSARISAGELVELLSGLISKFDRLALQHGIEKIKTIGDAYMAVAGLPEVRPDHAEAVIAFALDMLKVAAEAKTRDGTGLQLRIGVNSGPVVAGIIGTHKFAYDLWGDAVNTAARMEHYGQPGRIQLTESTYSRVRHRYHFESRGYLDIKGKGRMLTYLVINENEEEVTEAAIQATA